MDAWSSIDNYVNDSDAEGFDDDGEDRADECSPENDGKQKKRRKPSQAKKKNKEFEKLFNDNRQLFNLSCDCCEKSFESLDEARAHYPSEHNKPKGYIKSTSGTKLFNRCDVTRWVDRHLNPAKFKYVI